MKSTLEIKNNQILVNGIATTNPELIGLCVLDMVEENNGSPHAELKFSKIYTIDEIY